MPESTSKKAVSFSDLAEAAKLIATKAEVKRVQDNVDAIGGGVAYATTEEVLALFQEPAQSGGTESGT